MMMSSKSPPLNSFYSYAEFEKMYETAFEIFQRPGRVYVIAHLKSEKGKTLNGRRCTAVGSDKCPCSPGKLGSKRILDRRLHVKLLDPDTLKPTGNAIRIKPSNLVDQDVYCINIEPQLMPEEETIRRLHMAMEQVMKVGVDKGTTVDAFYRFKFMAAHFSSKGESSMPPPTTCLEIMTPTDEIEPANYLRCAVKLACSGDGTVDFRRFGTGLMGSETEECTICTESLSSGCLRLPCGHMFHKDCVKNWLEQHGNCPVCRTALKNPWHTYYFGNVGEQIETRMVEWYQSGMCERCQAVYTEADPIVAVNLPDGSCTLTSLSTANQQGLSSSQVQLGHMT